MKRYSKSTSIEKLTVVTIVIILLAALSPLLVKVFGGSGWGYSEGQRTGIPYKLSKKGVMYKTWEGQLSLQIMTQDANGRMVNQVFDYSVSSDDVAARINEASLHGKPITLIYKEYMLRNMKYGSTSYDVIDVKQSEEQ